MVGARKPTAIRRTEIARAVLRIIGTQGVTALTTSRLAAEVGVTSGALFRHFASQDDILRYANQHAVARIEATFPDDSLAPVRRIRTLAANRVRVLGADPGLTWFIHSDQAALALPADAAALLRTVVTRTRAFLLDALREGAADGSIRRDIDPEVLLVPVLGTIHTLIGTAGVRRLTAARRRSHERVLDGLMSLLTPSPIPRRTRQS